jgi:hypothetical protein
MATQSAFMEKLKKDCAEFDAHHIRGTNIIKARRQRITRWIGGVSATILLLLGAKSSTINFQDLSKLFSCLPGVRMPFIPTATCTILASMSVMLYLHIQKGLELAWDQFSPIPLPSDMRHHPMYRQD